MSGPSDCHPTLCMSQHLPQLMQLLFTAVFYVATGELSNLLPQLAYLLAHRANLEAASCSLGVLHQLCTAQSDSCSCVTALQSYTLTDIHTPYKDSAPREFTSLSASAFSASAILFAFLVCLSSSFIDFSSCFNTCCVRQAVKSRTLSASVAYLPTSTAAFAHLHLSAGGQLNICYQLPFVAVQAQRRAFGSVLDTLSGTKLLFCLGRSHRRLTKRKATAFLR